ncbi:unnamed protein product, partial [Staurois parvus]
MSCQSAPAPLPPRLCLCKLHLKSQKTVQELFFSKS